jgi:hypothetical protein
MGLPLCQQRALDRMEGALRASEPQLTAMYAMFGRLTAGEPIRAERLTRKRLRWRQPGTAMYAMVLIPVMFAAIIAGALFGGRTHTATACEASYAVGGVSPLAGRPSCTVSAKTSAAKSAMRKTISATARLACGTAGQAARFTTLPGHERPIPPAARVDATAAGPPGMC